MGKNHGERGDSSLGDPRVSLSDPSESPLFEREAELEQIEAALGRLHLGVGGCVLIRGELGTGKSRLMEAAAASARAVELPHWYGAGAATWQGEPLLLLRETLGGVEPPPTLPDRRSALLTEIESQVANVPHLLAIDDLHTADPATLSVLGELADHIEQFPLLLLLSYQPDLMPEPPGWFEAATLIDLHPLSPSVAPAFAGGLLGTRPGPALSHALTETGGAPLQIWLWLWDLEHRGGLVRESGTVELVNPAERPADLRDPRDLQEVALEWRRHLVGPDTFALMPLVAVLGGRFRLRDLAALAGEPPEVTATRLQPLLERGGAIRDGQWWTVQWRGMLQGQYRRLPASERARLHRACARVLQDRDGSPVVVAEHLLAAATSGDRAALAAARRAAALVTDRSPLTAAHLLQRAVGLLAPGDRQRDETVVDLVEALVAAGEMDTARQTGERELGRMPPGPERASLEITLLSAYHSGEGLEDLAATILRRPELPEHLRGAVLARRAMERVLSGRLDEAEADAREVLEGSGAPTAEAASNAVTGLAWAATARGDPERALRLLRERVAQPPWGRGAGLASVQEGHALYLLNRFDEALEVYYTRLRQLDRAGWPSRLRPLLLVGIADVHYGQGAWDEALGEWEAVIDGPASGVFSAAARARRMRALVAAHRGDYEPSRELRLARGGTAARPEDLEVDAILLEGEGDPAGATRIAQRMWRLQEARGGFGRLPFTTPWTIRFARAADVPDAELASLVAPMADRLLELSRHWTSDSVTGAATLARGVRDRNAAALSQAVQSYQRSPRASDHCLGLEVCGEELVRLDQVDLGVDALLGALDSYRTLGAEPAAERLLARLRDLGVRRGLRRPPVRPGVGWDSLSEEELTVAALVSAGLSNPRIAEQMGLPRYRVASVIETVIVKLGVASRLELGLLVARRAREGDLAESPPPGDAPGSPE